MRGDPTLETLADGTAYGGHVEASVQWLAQFLLDGRADGEPACMCPTYQSDPEKMCHHELADVKIAGLERLLADAERDNAQLAERLTRAEGERDETRDILRRVQQAFDGADVSFQKVCAERDAAREALRKVSRILACSDPGYPARSNALEVIAQQALDGDAQ